MIGELRNQGYAVIKSALPLPFCDELKAACYHARERFNNEIDDARRKRAGEEGVVRLPMKYSRVFYTLMAHPAIVEIAEQEIGKSAILHLQNAFVLPPDNSGNTFQARYHRDFPRYLNDYRASINVFVAVTDFTENTGALRVLPGSHQLPGEPDQEYLRRYSVPVTCPAGSLIVFDSTLYHAAGQNRSTMDRIGINHQFTPHFLKPQMDYVRALGEETILGAPPVAQKLLGWHSRVPASLDEYYRSESERVYRKGQG